MDQAAFIKDGDYNLLMSSMRVSVSKHLLDERFTVVWANDDYYDLIGYLKVELNISIQMSGLSNFLENSSSMNWRTGICREMKKK